MRHIDSMRVRLRRRASALPPGEFLHAQFLEPRGITQGELALALGVSRRRINEIVNGRRPITRDTAVRLAAYFRNDPAFWMHLQVAWDMHLDHAGRRGHRGSTG